MRKNDKPCIYGDYLQLDKLLSAQQPTKKRDGEYAHDETLFIIVHQAYELWFKQILHELAFVQEKFNQDKIDDADHLKIVHLLKRVIKIQQVINQQIDILETMNPQDFLEFRDYLVPASGFQSLQFKEIEIRCGLRLDSRLPVEKQFFQARIDDENRAKLEALQHEDSIFDGVEKWLERMPFINMRNFDFKSMYRQHVADKLQEDEDTLRSLQGLSDTEIQDGLKSIQGAREQFVTLFDDAAYAQRQQEGVVRLSQKAMLAALFIHVYRDQPALALPFQVLTCLADIEENLTMWRYRHVMMVRRMLGAKIGTGGSSGADYLRATTEKNTIFVDLLNMTTFLLPRSAIPVLPQDISEQLGFFN